jgi:DNA polymerase (family 10)
VSQVNGSSPASSGAGEAGHEIAERLREIAAYLRLVGEGPWKAQAYETAAGAVEALGGSLDELLASGRLTETPGIGESTAGVIAELRSTGTARRLEALRADFPPGLLELVNIPGLRLPRIRALYHGLGVRDLDDLRAAATSGKLRGLKGFGPRTEQKILEGLARYESRSTRVRLLDGQERIHSLAAVAARVPGIARVAIAGGVRRWKETIGTLRLVAQAAEPEPALQAFLQTQPLGRLERVRGECLRGRLSDGVALELCVVPPDTFAATLLRQTGSRAHVQRLEALARQRGWSLETAVAPDERALYQRLGLPEIPPELREDAGELEAARAGDDFHDLVTTADVIGMVHCHTRHSDGRATVEEMARAAEAMGMRYLTITDHSPLASYAGGLGLEALEAQWEEIAAVQAMVGIKLLRGTESDLLADGALDYPDEVLEQLDVIIGSVHNRFHLDEDQMTARLVHAMRLPLFKIWGHPLGRLLLRREPLACRLDEVLDAIASSRAAVEINGDPYRLDLPPEHVRAARQRGIKFVISTDAHSTTDLQNLPFGVAMARRGGVRRQEVLNTLAADEFAEAVRPRR